jgi:phage anti-repressor protein
MRITEFLKRHSLINNKFIDDFYSFYDENKNEFDYTINLEKLAYWLEIQKSHLMRLLESNFIEGDDYIILDKTKNGKGMGIGKNNKKTVMLRYICAKELCMISKCEKATVIRKFYIDIEKLIITYKDSIVRDLNNQLGINAVNNQLIEKHKNRGLIYVLKIDDSKEVDYEGMMQVKIGKTHDLEKRMKQYNVGRVSELPIVFVYLTNQIDELENCINQNLKTYQIKNKTETFEIDISFIKDTIKYCTLKNALLIKQNKKLFNKKDNKKFLIIIDKERLDRVDEIIAKTCIKPKKTNTKISNTKISNTKKTNTKRSNTKISNTKRSNTKRSNTKKYS